MENNSNRRNVKSLNEAHRAFIQHYIKYNNAVQAYIHAYPNATYSTALKESSRLLKADLVMEELNNEKEKLAIINHIDKNDLLEKYMIVAEEAREAKNYAAFAKISDMINKMTGQYVAQKIEHSGDMGVSVIKLTEVIKRENKKGTDS